MRLLPLWPTVWSPPHHTCRPVPRVSLASFPCCRSSAHHKTQRIARRPTPTPRLPLWPGLPLGLSPSPFQSPHARSPPRVGPRSRWPRAAAPCSRSSSSATAGERFGSPLPPCEGFSFCLTSVSCDLGLGRRP